MQHDLESDRKLTERARQGDEASWRAIYESTCDRLFAFLCFQCGELMEDFVADQAGKIRGFGGG